jgi:hypothetical protein
VTTNKREPGQVAFGQGWGKRVYGQCGQVAFGQGWGKGCMVSGGGGGGGEGMWSVVDRPSIELGTAVRTNDEHRSLMS